jgi:hypothetical protein
MLGTLNDLMKSSEILIRTPSPPHTISFYTLYRFWYQISFLFKGFVKRHTKLVCSYELLSPVLIHRFLILMDPTVPLVLQCPVSLQSNKYIFTFIHIYKIMGCKNSLLLSSDCVRSSCLDVEDLPEGHLFIL